MEQDSVIPVVIAVVLCIVGCIIYWCWSQMRPRQTNTPTDVAPQTFPRRLVPQAAAYLQGVALRKYQAPEFYDFIQNVIDLFNGQRLKEDQFAVLIFTAESTLSRMGEIKFQAPGHTTYLVDNTYPYFPHHNLKNYLVARPDGDGRHHCEKILLDHEDQLWDAYTEDHPTGPKCIILYSWLLPCSECTSEILTYHTRTRPAVKLIVVFTSGWRRQSNSVNLNNIARMQDADIDVHQVSYSRTLPPAC